MSMGLYSQPGVYQSTWIEMKSDVTMRYETDRDDERATFYFGTGDEYVLNISRNNLNLLLEIGSAAWRELSPRPATPPR